MTSPANASISPIENFTEVALNRFFTRHDESPEHTTTPLRTLEDITGLTTHDIEKHATTQIKI
jgi:hypothetical protein